jgi:hypothetical protein
VSSVFPRTGLLDRAPDVVVTAEAVTFDNTTTASSFDFGANITVSNVNVISATSAWMHLVIDKTATVGPRDVKVTVGGKTLTGTKAFNVAAPLQVTLATGATSQAQAGLFQASLYNLDHTAFDPNNLRPDGLVSIFPYGNQTGATATNASFTFLVDPLAATGAAALVMGNAALDGSFPVKFMSGSTDLTITATTPTALTFGTATNGSIATALQTGFYKMSMTGAAIVHQTLTQDTTSTLNPVVIGYGTSGLSQDILQSSIGGGGFPPSDTVYPVDSAQDAYFVVGDYYLQSGSTLTYSITATKTDVPAANVIAFSGTHDTGATALPLAGLPGIATGTSTSTATTPSFDVYSFTAAANDLYELTMLSYGDQVAVVAPACAAPPCSGGGPAGVDFGNYNTYVSSFQPTHTAYSVSTVGIPTAGTWYLVLIGQYGGQHPGGTYKMSIRKTN